VRNLRLTALLFLLAAGIAAAVDINIVALTSGKAVVSINGAKPRAMTVGQISPEGVKLIAATSDSAVFEVDGKRQTFTMGQGKFMGGGSVSAQQATLVADSGGHFLTVVQVNNSSIKFIVDTGASLVTISSNDAKRAGINYFSGQKATLQTANGATSAYRVKFDTVRLGEITLNNVDGAVVEGNVMGEYGLLGMSFLNRLKMRREGSTMTLTKSF